LPRPSTPSYLAPPGPTRAAWPAVLLCGAVAVAALVGGQGPGRFATAVGLALAAAAPFVALAVVEGRMQVRALHLRAGQVAQLRWREAWQRMSAWEICDAVAELLRRDGMRVDWLPTPLEAADAYFGATGATAERQRLVVRVLRGAALDAGELSEAVGRAVLSGAERLVIVALGGVDLPKSLDPPRAPGALEIEVWREGDVLERAEQIASLGAASR